MISGIAERYNLVRWTPRGDGGLVESLFLKFHGPERGQAFWARYTLRRPRRGCGEPVGGLWAVFSQAGAPPVAGCDIHPAREVAFGDERFYLRIGTAELTMGRATGRVLSGPEPIEWDLTFEVGGPGLVHFPSEALYRTAFPRNKLASPHLLTRFFGTLRVGARAWRVSGAPGMQGHNWGPEVSAHWVWLHAARFDAEPDAVIEAVSSRLRVGPALAPPLTIVALRFRGREVLWNRPLEWFRTRSRLSGLSWRFATRGRLCVEGEAQASPQDAVALDYLSSDGKPVRCVNSNLARVRVVVRGLLDRPVELVSEDGATLELGGLAAPQDLPVRVTG